MARKISVTNGQIVDAAFELTKKEGFEGLTARKLAKYMGCSTQPIFRVFQTMDELYDEIYVLIMKDFSDYYNGFANVSDTPFINLGLSYIRYAQRAPKFFEILFLKEKRCGKGLYELLNGSQGNLVKEINKAKNEGAANPSELFMKMWIFIHGAACMVITKDYDLDSNQTIRLLQDSYESYMSQQKN